MNALTEYSDLIDPRSNSAASSSHCVVVVGLGYVGLPLAVAFAEAGLNVVGFDIEPNRVAAVNNAQSYIDDISNQQLADVVEQSQFVATDDESCFDRATDIIVCVPTPLTQQRTPDMRAIDASARTIARHLHRGQLLVLESTTYPGTTQEVLLPTNS